MGHSLWLIGYLLLQQKTLEHPVIKFICVIRIRETFLRKLTGRPCSKYNIKSVKKAQVAEYARESKSISESKGRWQSSKSIGFIGSTWWGIGIKAWFVKRFYQKLHRRSPNFNLAFSISVKMTVKSRPVFRISIIHFHWKMLFSVAKIGIEIATKVMTLWLTTVKSY